MNYYARPQTPPAVVNLLIINALAFMGMELVPGAREFALEYLALFPVQSPLFRPWQVVTHMFLHANMLHIFSNMFALWMFGRSLEANWGTRRFLVYYFVCGLGAAALQLAVNAFDPSMIFVPTLGASGAVFGVLLAFGMMFPDVRLMLLFPPIPLKAKWFVILYGLFELVAGVTGRMDGIAHFAHLGGMIFGFFLLRYWKHRRRIYYPIR